MGRFSLPKLTAPIGPPPPCVYLGPSVGPLATWGVYPRPLRGEVKAFLQQYPLIGCLLYTDTSVERVILGRARGESRYVRELELVRGYMLRHGLIGRR